MTARWRGTSVRTIVIGSFLFLSVYLVGFTAYLVLRIAPAAVELERETMPVLGVFQSITGRMARLDKILGVAHQSMDRAIQPDAVESVRDLLRLNAARAMPAPFARIPVEMRVVLARADDQAAQIETRVQESIALVDLGRQEEGRVLLRVADSLSNVAGHTFSEAQALGLRDVVTRQQRMGVRIQPMLGLSIAWALIGGALLIMLLALARARVERPLAELEDGLELVAAGDLAARVPVRHADEIGRLSEHFNQMTSVLRARAEEQGRFAAAGHLMAGVAHEVNNPLMAIAALAHVRLEEAELPDDLRADLEQIRRQARRAGTLLSGLLRFVSPGEAAPSGVSLTSVVRSALTLVAYRFAVEDIELDEQLDPALPAALGAATRLEQVFVNLLTNAVDAMEGAPGPRRLSVSSWRSDDRVGIVIADTGPGVAPDMVGRLFRPFVTSKGTSGTGLGLYISRQIMRDAGGDLVYEPEGHGARFAAWLPAVTMVPVPVAPPAGAAEPGSAGLAGARVLFVEDEEAVRTPIAKFLRRRGAIVAEAEDGAVALQRLDGATFDVVLADLRMPGIGGVELYDRLLASRPAVARRLIFLSGDLTQLETAGGLPVPRNRVLAKPAELREIERALLDMLREEGPAA